jgi:uncharacterized protein (DUF2147 family)
MKRLVLAAALLFVASAAHAETPSPQGFWARGDGKAKVKIEPCGADLCAINTWIKPGTRDEKVDDKLVMTVREAAPGHWTGSAFDPQRNLRYRLKMDVAEKTMTTSGCVLGGLLCKGVNWTRIVEE